MKTLRAPVPQVELPCRHCGHPLSCHQSGEIGSCRVRACYCPGYVITGGASLERRILEEEAAFQRRVIQESYARV